MFLSSFLLKYTQYKYRDRVLKKPAEEYCFWESFVMALPEKKKERIMERFQMGGR